MMGLERLKYTNPLENILGMHRFRINERTNAEQLREKQKLSQNWIEKHCKEEVVLGSKSDTDPEEEP